MKRKVIKQANQAYTITLPISWVRENKIDEKSELEVTENGKTLTLSNLGAVYQKKIKLDVSGFDKRNLFRHINSLYAAGYDEIELISKEEISNRIIEILNYLIGYALVAQSKGSYIIKDVGGTSSSDLDEVFKRVFQAVLLFYDSAIEDIFGKEEETEKCLKMRDLEVNKLCLYLQRSINKMSYKDPIKGRALFTYSFELEKIGDDILRLWRDNMENKIKKTKELKELALLSKKSLEGAFDTYYMFNSQMSERYCELRHVVRKKAEEIKEKNLLSRNIVKIAEDATDLAHLTLMMKLE